MIKRLQVASMLLIFNFWMASGQELKKEYQIMVARLVEYIRLDKKENIANLIKYPLDREYPIPSVRNKQDFIKRYNEIFDSHFKQIFINSKPAKKWSDMGWRGIMLNDGDLWLDTDGRLIAVNYQSNEEKIMLNKLISEDKKSVHSSIAQYFKPKYILETSRFRIRIDDLGNNKYRYASWSKSKPMTVKPDLIMNNGDLEFDGSGGNESITFVNGEYVYTCFINPMGEVGSSPAVLSITKDGKEILTQDARIIRN